MRAARQAFLDLLRHQVVQAMAAAHPSPTPTERRTQMEAMQALDAITSSNDYITQAFERALATLRHTAEQYGHDPDTYLVAAILGVNSVIAAAVTAMTCRRRRRPSEPSTSSSDGDDSQPPPARRQRLQLQRRELSMEPLAQALLPATSSNPPASNSTSTTTNTSVTMDPRSP